MLPIDAPVGTAITVPPNGLVNPMDPAFEIDPAAAPAATEIAGPDAVSVTVPVAVTDRD